MEALMLKNKYSFKLANTNEKPLGTMIVEVYMNSQNEQNFKAFSYIANGHRTPWYHRLYLALLYLFIPSFVACGNLVLLSAQKTEMIIALCKALDRTEDMYEKYC